MSQKVTRKSAVSEDKEKRQTDSPVKDMKKKMAANAEKEKQTAEKSDKNEKSTDKKDVEKAEKNEKADKKSEEKKEQQPEKSKEEGTSKEDKSAKGNAKEDKNSKADKEKPAKDSSKAKQNGSRHNGATNGTASNDSEDEDAALVIDDHDELFPELTYDDSDVDFDASSTPDAQSRSLTRRSQVKATRTPETPRPASDKQADKDADYDPAKDSKVLKLKDDAPPTDRKLRSADSPKPDGKKTEDKDKKEEGKKETEGKKDKKAEKGKDVEVIDITEDSKEDDKKKDKSKESEKEVVVTVEVEGADDGARLKPDTNYSKSRVRVSPYRRAQRADLTDTSLQANYTGNNTTMEMDITESSSFIEDATLDDSSYLRGLRSIRGRSSYKPLKEMTLRHITVNKSVTSTTSAASPGAPPVGDGRPTAPVVGRKRAAPAASSTCSTSSACSTSSTSSAWGKRARLLDSLALPFRRHAPPARANAEIVGINTDLPLTVPTAATDSFDPETLKPQPEPPIAVPLVPDNKRCIIM